ncbi:uncharacterized protein LOC128183163 [Crassostrea angulata]|uniref:uncharacterized protein LOC128183163 n=1 Tax=Magallana angulata TaxID=2784310 RepID=UPI0022B1A25C|nr:uncharacterized protein LOC128183163 [Crassostrea angulata]
MDCGILIKANIMTTTGIKEAVIRIGIIYAVFLCLHCLSCAEGLNITKTGDGHQNQQDEQCAIFISDLYNSSGPLNVSMCIIHLQKIQCQSGLKKKCLPFIANNDEFACCINASGLQNVDDQCIKVTHIQKLDKYVAQCYGKEECKNLKRDVTSPIPVPQTVDSTSPVFGIIIIVIVYAFLCLLFFFSSIMQIF